jgi:hypothetical protein
VAKSEDGTGDERFEAIGAFGDALQMMGPEKSDKLRLEFGSANDTTPHRIATPKGSHDSLSLDGRTPLNLCDSSRN